MTRVLSPYELPCGLVTVDLPYEWDLVAQGYNHATFRCDEGRMSIECLPFERPDVIASGNFKELFWDFLSDEYFQKFKPALEEWWADGGSSNATLSDRVETTDGGLHSVTWRQVAICPPHHVRQLTWRFEADARVDGHALRDFAEDLHRVVIPRTQFSTQLMEFDRVGPSPALKMVPMGDSIFIRMPPHWMARRENEDGTGRRLVDEPELDRWTLWFDWNQLGNDSNPPRDEGELRKLIDDSVQLMRETLQGGTQEVKSGFGMDRIVVQHIAEDGLVTTNWNRVSVVDGNLFFVHLSFNVVESEAGDSDIPALRELIEHELINAVLVPKQEREGDAPPAELKEVSLALGLFRVKVPGDWVLEDDFPFHTIFRLPDGGTMTMKALVYEDPEIERTGDYASYLLDILDESEHDALHKMLEQWIEVPGLPVLTISARAQADDGAWYRNVWRSMQARPPLYRTVTWEYAPASTGDGRSLVRTTDALHENFQRIEFAEGPADLDLVAATPELKVASFGNSVILRIPIEWKRSRENDDGTGRHCIDEPGDLDRWTLWVDWDLFINGDRPGRPFKTDGLTTMEGFTGQFVTDRGDKVFTASTTTDDNQILYWHRIGSRGDHVVIAHFSLVMDKRQLDHPEIVAVRELVGREALRALLIPRPPKG